MARRLRSAAALAARRLRGVARGFVLFPALSTPLLRRSPPLAGGGALSSAVKYGDQIDPWLVSDPWSSFAPRGAPPSSSASAASRCFPWAGWAPGVWARSVVDAATTSPTSCAPALACPLRRDATSFVPRVDGRARDDPSRCGGVSGLEAVLLKLCTRVDLLEEGKKLNNMICCEVELGFGRHLPPVLAGFAGIADQRNNMLTDFVDKQLSRALDIIASLSATVTTVNADLVSLNAKFDLAVGCASRVGSAPAAVCGAASSDTTLNIEFASDQGVRHVGVPASPAALRGVGAVASVACMPNVESHDDSSDDFTDDTKYAAMWNEYVRAADAADLGDSVSVASCPTADRSEFDFNDCENELYFSVMLSDIDFAEVPELLEFAAACGAPCCPLGLEYVCASVAAVFGDSVSVSSCATEVDSAAVSGAYRSSS